MKRISLALLLLATSAIAQPMPPPSYVAPDRDLWETMSQALAEIPASARAHQQIQNILQTIQREAYAREQAKQAAPPMPPIKPPKLEPPKDDQK
jgi:hypothetical protein